MTLFGNSRIDNFYYSLLFSPSTTNPNMLEINKINCIEKLNNKEVSITSSTVADWKGNSIGLNAALIVPRKVDAKKTAEMYLLGRVPVTSGEIVPLTAMSIARFPLVPVI